MDTLTSTTPLLLPAMPATVPMTDEQITITMSEQDWLTITGSLYKDAGEHAALEARRTGGYGYASGGVMGHVKTLHRLRDTLLDAVYAWRDKQPCVMSTTLDEPVCLIHRDCKGRP